MTRNLKQIIFSGKYLLQKWKNIRTIFGRGSQRKADVENGAEIPRRSFYIYFQKLLFFKKTSQNNPNQGSIDETKVVNNDDVGGDVQSHSPVTEKKNLKNDSLVEEQNKSITLKENRKMKEIPDAENFFMLTLMNSFREIPEYYRFSELGRMGLIKRAEELALEMNNPSYFKTVPKTLCMGRYTYSYGPEPSTYIVECNFEYFNRRTMVQTHSENNNITMKIQHRKITD